jgi:glycine cleavage system transcriptional repressor
VGHLALSAIGRDRPGIVAAVTRVLLDHGVNIEDSQMTILRGHFTMTLIVGVPEAADRERLESDLQAVAEQLGLEAISLKDVEEVSGEPAEPSHIVTVYGSDHPGIVCATAEAIARHGYNITDLNTRLVGDAEGDPLYALMMEVAIPPGHGEELRSAMTTVGRQQGVEVSVRELEQDEL